jgi:hypothetical protein
LFLWALSFPQYQEHGNPNGEIILPVANVKISLSYPNFVL